MNKTELLEMALEKLTAASNYIDTLGGVSKGYRMDIERLKAALEAKDEFDWKDMYEKQKRHSEMWVAKYEKDIGPLEKAVPQQEAKDEPVAWKLGSSGIGGMGVIVEPQRTWVGLTDEEVADIERNSITRRQAIRAIEAKLRSKNYD